MGRTLFVPDKKKEAPVPKNRAPLVSLTSSAYDVGRAARALWLKSWPSRMLPGLEIPVARLLNSPLVPVGINTLSFVLAVDTAR